jgi:hypothetical protein
MGVVVVPLWASESVMSVSMPAGNGTAGFKAAEDTEAGRAADSGDRHPVVRRQCHMGNLQIS